MEHIFLPTTVEFLPTDRPNVGKVLLTPCHQGYGTTIGNALRRVLLSSLPGAAVESIKIDGVQHEFSGLSGVREDVIEIILNIKHLAVILHEPGPVTVTLTKKGKGMVTGADIAKTSAITVVNPELEICTITDAATNFSMDITIGQGRGYVPAADKNTKQWDLGTIAVDSLYTPIRDVGYDVELTRVGDVTDYEKLVLTVMTNGTVTPKAAIEQSASILIDHFALLNAVAGDIAETSEPMVLSEEATESESESEEVPVKKEKKKKKTT